MAYETICPAIQETLTSAGYTVNFCGFSALDRYMGLPSLPFVWAETDADVQVLARLFEGLRFPGVDLANGAVETEGGSWYFRCLDSEELRWGRMIPGVSENWRPSYTILSLTQDSRTQRFRDPGGIYPLIRRLRDGLPKNTPVPGTAAEQPAGFPWWTALNPETGRCRALMDGALILARYGPEHGALPIAGTLRDLPRDVPPAPETQRVLLTALLVSRRPDLGLELLKAGGFVGELWPELAGMDKVDHSKEFHPEGNVWKHTLETFRYRKTILRSGPAAALPGKGHDLRLSLGLLLHDLGKPLAAASGPRRFDGHAEIGARAARKFLERLGYEAGLINDVCYLVKNHMLPAALPRLPLVRTEEILKSSLFPTLLELYRCDESSSFKGLEGYYESSAAYQAYLRYRRNPYRSADGKKLGKRRLL
jgi:poly(A) polymerase